VRGFNLASIDENQKKKMQEFWESMLDSLEIRHKDYVFRGEKKKGGTPCRREISMSKN